MTFHRDDRMHPFHPVSNGLNSVWYDHPSLRESSRQSAFTGHYGLVLLRTFLSPTLAPPLTVLMVLDYQRAKICVCVCFIINSVHCQDHTCDLHKSANVYTSGK